MKPFLTILIAAALLCPLVAAQEETDPLESNKALVRSFSEAANARDYETVGSLVADNFTRHCPATPGLVVTNRDQFIEFLKVDAATFPDNRQTADILVAEGDLVAFWGLYEGTQEGPMGPFPASHKKLSDNFAGVFRIENGKLAELWVTWDNLAMLTQLGHFPPPQPEEK